MQTSGINTSKPAIDPVIKKEAETILNAMGLTAGKSIELFYRQVIAQRGLPFEMHVPNEKTMKAVENSRQGKGMKFNSTDKLFDDLGI